MRFLIAILPLLVVSCERDVPQGAGPATLKVGHYFEKGGSGLLCVKPGPPPQRAIFIAFGKDGTTNCSADGTLEAAGSILALVPKGEGACRIPVVRQGKQLTFGPTPAACAYYCGPGVTLGGQLFTWTDTSTAELLAYPEWPDDAPC